MKTRIKPTARPRKPAARDSKPARGKITKPAVTPATVKRRARQQPEQDTAQWNPVPGSAGKRIRRVLPTDDQNTERLVQDGVNEAGQDEMLAARKSGTVLDE